MEVPLSFLLLVTFVAVPEPAGAAQGPPLLPVAEARRLALAGSRQGLCLEGVVTMETGLLRSGPSDFYLQDGSGGIQVQGMPGVRVDRGLRVRACGLLGLYDELEPEVLEARVSVIARDRPPPARELSLGEALDGRAAGSLVRVRGRVERVSIGETRDVIWLGPSSPALRVYIRRAPEAPSQLASTAPVGAQVEVTGILIPEEANKYQLRLRSPGDVVLLVPPEPAELVWLKRGAVALAAGVVLAAIWVWTLRRAVRRQTEEIRRLMVEAKQSEEAKSRFLANMSHEIRTPLNGILGMTELALDTPLSAEQRSYLETIRNSARTLLEIVNAILDFSRIEKGRLEIVSEPFSLQTLLDESLPLVAVEAERKGLRMEVDVDASLPALLVGDGIRLRQVLLNLLSNAVKFTHAGFVRLQVRGAGPGLVRFEVSDSGIGIPEEKQREIFEAFTQADSSITRRYGGAGLGLTISDELVRRMGGKLELESRPGQGSRFFFTLPLRAPAGGTLRDVQPPASCPEERRLRVLLAEDNPINRRAVERLLERMGHEVRSVGDGARAVEEALGSQWDLILMDIQMPELEGLEATRRIREGEARSGAARTPIIGLTAHAFAEDVERCLAAGMDDCLLKPFHLDDLRRLLGEWTSRSCQSAS
jgi:signal transduction histidine kinase/ActR/RegA family two-component response regulator